MNQIKTKLISELMLKKIAETKYNEVWQGDAHTLIFNKVTGQIKIKTRY